MSVLNFAKDIERQGIDYYSKLAEETPIASLKGIFTFLANEERRHLAIFEDLGQGKTEKELPQTDVMGEAKKTFEELAKDFKAPETVYDYEAAYTKALGLEKKSIELYEDARGKLEDPKQQEVLDFIISQEQNHAALMDNLIVLSRRPKTWLENAEWYRLDAY